MVVNVGADMVNVYAACVHDEAQLYRAEALQINSGRRFLPLVPLSIRCPASGLYQPVNDACAAWRRYESVCLALRQLDGEQTKNRKCYRHLIVYQPVNEAWLQPYMVAPANRGWGIILPVACIQKLIEDPFLRIHILRTSAWRHVHGVGECNGEPATATVCAHP